MPISSAAAGSLLDTSRERISVRRILAYAAGIGATGSPAFDDDREGGVVAMPPFCVSLEWPVVSGARARDGLGAAGPERYRGVHASQDSFFHRPIRPGDDLETRGRIASVRADARRRAGVDEDRDGRRRDRRAGGHLVDQVDLPRRRGGGGGGGDRGGAGGARGQRCDVRGRRARVALSIPREMPHVYTECASIWNPIHTERAVALAAGLPDIILHGTATWALAGREVLRLYADGDPRRLRRLHGRFRGMVFPGTEITIEHARAVPRPARSTSWCATIAASPPIDQGARRLTRAE